MPDGAAQAELRAHVNYQVRRLVTEGDPGDAVERLKTRWAWSYIAMSVLIPLIFFSGLDPADPKSTARVLIGFALGFGVSMYGLYQLIELGRERNAKKFKRQREADASRATPPGGGA